MKISVLVPVYGVEKYIARCAESLFGQTYADLEFVFVDDCTPDHSIDVLRSVMARYPARQAQVRIIYNEKNSGIGAVRQKLIDSCTGDCLTFVDSDDYMPLDAISLLAAGMERSGADMVDGGWQRVTRDGRLFTDNGIRLVPGIDFCEDFSVMTRLMFYARRSFINDSVYFYSDDNAGSYTHTTSPKHVRSFLRSNRVVLDFFTTHDTEGRFTTPLQIGMLNVLRTIRSHNLDFGETDSLLGYKPEGAVFRLSAALLRGKCPFWLAEKFYLTIRKVWTSLH